MPKQGDVDTTYPNLLEIENKILLLEPFVGAKKHHKMKCLVCNHEWSATPLSKRQTFKKYGVGGCPNCNNIKRKYQHIKTREKNLQTLKDRGIEILTEGYDGRRHLIDHNTYTKILVRNLQCGHEFYCSPSNLLSQNVECSVCGPQKRVEPLTAWSKENSRKWQETATEWEKYKHEVHNLTRKTYTKHKKKINPKNLPRGKAGVEGAFHLDHIVPIRFCFDNNIPAEMCAHPTNLQMLHWNDNVGSRNHLKGSIPHGFLQYLPSTLVENRAIETLNEIFPASEKFKNLHSIIATLYDKESNTAIILIPTSEAFANQKTAITVAKALEKNNVRFFILFEDEILSSQDLVLSKLKHYVNHNISTPKIHGRKCTIEKIDSIAKRQFLDTFHIQGNDNSQLSFGAFYGDILVAVMTFSKPRVALGYKNKDRTSYDGVWELSRFATNSNYRIPGIASKLLKHFERSYKPTKIISYADRRWSVGNLYYKLDFELEAINPPDYFYVIGGQRKHRWNYRKDILKTKLKTYDATKTEYENMREAGFWRVWDCGTYRFVKKY